MGKSRADLPWPVLEDLDDALESMTGQNDHCVTTHVTHVQKYIYIYPNTVITYYLINIETQINIHLIIIMEHSHT